MVKLQNWTSLNCTKLSKVQPFNSHLFNSFVKKKTRLLAQLGAFSFGVFSSIFLAVPGLGAERISFSIPVLGEFYISTKSLEAFVKEGEITDEFAFYAQRVKPQQLTQLREMLQKRLEVTPTLVSQFTYSPIGEQIVNRLGELIRMESRQNGFHALRAAFILSAADSEGLTLLNVIRHYPSPTIRINVNEAQEIMSNFSELLRQRNALVAAVQETAYQEATRQPLVDFSQQRDLQRSGSVFWQRQVLEMNDRTRDRRIAVDVYMPPEKSTTPLPVIVISHGLAENRQTFTYVAQHLASHGFAVVVLEHPGSDTMRLQKYFAGLAISPSSAELLNRPLDVKFVLDELQLLSSKDSTFKGKLNLQEVGVLGHSLGGYTALTLGGATIDFEQIHQLCRPNRSFNLSVFLQCSADDLPVERYPIQDQRVKAVMALNPLSSVILGQKGLSQIQVPVMFVAASQDIFTPPVQEQIQPFTWLQTPDKYLALIENGTHLSATIMNPDDQILPIPSSLIGPEPAIAHSYINALSLAFFQTHLMNRQEYRPYLSASYAEFISQAPLNLSLVQSFTAEQFTQSMKRMHSVSVISSGQ